MLVGKRSEPIKKILSCLTLAAGLVSGGLHAAPITIGSLTYDADTNAGIISDSLNHRDWMRWDALSVLEYETGVSTGSYLEWKVANHVDAAAFIESLRPVGKGEDCKDPLFSSGCWSDRDATRNYHAILGDSFTPGNRHDFAFFTSPSPSGVGIIKAEQSGPLFRASKNLDFSLSNFTFLKESVGWLLYRDQPAQTLPFPTNVSEPSSLVLLSISIFGLGLYRKKSMS